MYSGRCFCFFWLVSTLLFRVIVSFPACTLFFRFIVCFPAQLFCPAGALAPSAAARLFFRFKYTFVFRPIVCFRLVLCFSGLLFVFRSGFIVCFPAGYILYFFSGYILFFFSALLFFFSPASSICFFVPVSGFLPCGSPSAFGDRTNIFRFKYTFVFWPIVCFPVRLIVCVSGFRLFALLEP